MAVDAGAAGELSGGAGAHQGEAGAQAGMPDRAGSGGRSGLGGSAGGSSNDGGASGAGGENAVGLSPDEFCALLLPRLRVLSRECAPPDDLSERFYGEDPVTRFCDTGRAAIAAGRLKYDPVVAQACAAATLGDCFATAALDRPLSPECTGLVAAAVPLGGACVYGSVFSVDECTEGFCPLDHCPATCTPYLSEGEDCNSWDRLCDAGLYCGENRTCKKPVSVGEDCSKAPCEDELTCQTIAQNQAPACEPWGALGEACGPEVAQCVHGLVCYQGKCADEVPLEAPCAVDANCPDAAYCQIPNTCKALTPLGGDCTSTPCVSSAKCYPDHKCGPLGQAGETCPCSDGLWCDDNYKCRVAAPAGQPCFFTTNGTKAFLQCEAPQVCMPKAMGSTSDYSCASAGGEGDLCDPARAETCKLPFFCESTTWTCKMPVGIGESCNPNLPTDSCEEGLFCSCADRCDEPSFASGTCQQPKALGEACTIHQGCESRRCVHDYCAANYWDCTEDDTVGPASCSASGVGPGSVSNPCPGVQIAAGQDHTCVLLPTGKVHCWGSANLGQLGYANTNAIGDNEAPSTAGDVDVGGQVIQIATGGSHTCALLAGGTVRCWGSGLYGQLGYGNTNNIGDNETPASAGDVNVGGKVTQIALGFEHTCALLATGKVRCWGRNFAGQLGYGNTKDIGDDETPATAGDVDIAASLVTQVAAGGHRSCALLSFGGVRCWGQDDFHGLGYGQTNMYIGALHTPSWAGDIDLGGPAVQIGVGVAHVCAVLTSGHARCWGWAYGRRIGYIDAGNDIGDDERPVTAGDIDVGDQVRQVALGDAHTCVLLANGSVRCFGIGLNGANGYMNKNVVSDIPSVAGDVDVGGVSLQLSLGKQYSCAVLADLNVRCWGSGAFGQLGYANTNDVGDDETPASAGNVSYQ